MNSESKIPVVVFDTNVLVSAIQFDKLPQIQGIYCHLKNFRI